MVAETAFVDTNVLLYAHDSTVPQKQQIAQSVLSRLWEERTGALSTQVLQEFYHVATRKLTHPMRRAEAREIVDIYTAWSIVLVEPSLILTASQLEERQGLSFWDALIIEAARVAGATTLVTEDMQSARFIDGIRIENPFAMVSR